mgnify:CR=1 FL=1
MRISKKAQEWFVADFETTSKVYYDKHGYAKVWLWAVCDSNTEIVGCGDSIESFMEWLEQHSGALVYFHNLKFDGSFILNYLLENKFRYDDDLHANDPRGFSALLGDMGEWYQVKINFTNRVHVTIQDSLKIIPLKVKEIAKAFKLPIEKEIIDYERYEINETTLHYIYHDVQIVAMALKYFRDQGFVRMTIGSNAFNSFKEESGLPHTTFPKLDRDWLKEWRGAYRGGRSQVNPRFANEILHDVRRYDINSMYPYTMCACPMPFGLPIECNIPGIYNFELYDIDIDFDLKNGHLPTLLKTASIFSKAGDSYYKSTDGIINIKISNIDLELVKRHYSINYIKYNKIYGFKTRADIFKEWVMKYYNLKAVSEGGLRLLYKLIINNLYGKFGSRPTGQNKVPYLGPNGLEYELTDEHDMGIYYLPVAIAVTSYAHRLIDDAIMTTGYDNFVYCDTDSVHTLGTLPDSMVDSKEIGKFKLESTEKISKYIRQKCYIYKEYSEKKKQDEWSITCAGMPESLKDYLVRMHGDDVINAFRVGLHLDENSEGITRKDMKLRPMQVKGGCVLAPVPFSLN